MNHDEENKKSIQDKLANLKYNSNTSAHLKVDLNKCEKCKEKTCTFICPANVYEYNEDIAEITVQYENCLECGACRISCPKDAISWEYPASGSGVIFKNS